MRYTASCHCGKLKYALEGTIDQALSCNCSICSRKGALLWFVPRDAVTWITPAETASTYTFNKHVIKHRFCPVCGIHAFGEGVDRSGKPMIAVNLRCVENLDPASLKVVEFDGRAL